MNQPRCTNFWSSRFLIRPPGPSMSDPKLVAYFSFTNSNTKIAQTPTVTGNWAACVLLQRASSRKQKREEEHRYSGEYSEDQFAFPGHRRFSSRWSLAHSVLCRCKTFTGRQRNSTLEPSRSAILGLVHRIPPSSVFLLLAMALSSGVGARIFKQSLNNKVTTAQHPQ